MSNPFNTNSGLKFIIDHTKLIEDAIDFPVCLIWNGVSGGNIPSQVYTSGIHSPLSDGRDIRFSLDVDGNEQLSSEVVTFIQSPTATSANIEIWVKLPIISSTTDTFFYMWYNNPDAIAIPVGDPYGRNSVWSDYSAVYHMNGTVDSTGHGFDGTDHLTTSATSTIGFARQFTPAATDNQSYIIMPQDLALGNAFTLFAIIDWTSTSFSQGVPLGNDNSDIISLGDSFGLRVTPRNELVNYSCAYGYYRYTMGGGSGHWRVTLSQPVALSGTGVRSIAYSVDPANSIQKVLVDGAYVSATTFSDPPVIDIAVAPDSTIGSHSPPETYYQFGGKIDEVRVTRLARSENWIKSLTETTLHATTFVNNYVVFTIESTAGANGTIDPIGSNAYVSGSSVTFTITPNEDYDISTLTVDGTEIFPVLDSYTFNNLMTNHNISATFESKYLVKNRYRDNKTLNLTKFLPSMYQESETRQFTQFFEDFLNTLFDGTHGLSVSASDISPVSGDYSLSGVSGVLVPYQYYIPQTTSTVSATTNTVEWNKISTRPDNSNKISILEKVYRLAELKDPDLIDIEYIQYFAANMGYNIDVFRSEVGNVSTSINDRPASSPLTSASDINSYLRFMVSNLPNWYKIKATNSAIRVMLYSFGLVGDLVQYYTENYLEISQGGKWAIDTNKNLDQIPKNYFLTPHFALRINIDDSADLLVTESRRASVLRAINSLQPINTVLRGLLGYAERTFEASIEMTTRISRYIRVEVGDEYIPPVPPPSTGFLYQTSTNDFLYQTSTNNFLMG